MVKRALTLALILLVFSSFLAPLSSAQQTKEERPKYDLILVRNDDMIDYIVALPYAKMLDVPILPVNPKELDPGTIAQLQSYAQFGWNHVLIIGDSQAISDTVQDELLNMGFVVERIGGAVRTETAAKLALHFYPNGYDTVVLASSSDYGSTLAAARWAMIYGLPLLLTQEDALSDSTLNALKKLHPDLVILMGAGMSKDIEIKLQGMGYQTYWYKENLDIKLPSQPKETNWVTIVAAVLLSLAVAVPLSIYYAKKRWAANRVPIEVLTEKERIVVKAILDRGGTVKQEELPELTGYSRPTISRIIQELEKKQLVEREKIGKTFTVKLTKEIIIRD
ncbi:cell wall-binding repeat-containing protein [Thermococcus sp. 21S7]|uniref:cell wall-binding repeat-containing protein n=1 Tax=Thermococcus sp. 21S7 TaxID=1638221 RepID=UPI0014394BE5|nr:cell wall-binding repeat-containing protein [Thermococcus sp. 21S7]NJE60369.1 MarR family transcriptional regulator [Thermococcus sp. 21S7]